MATLKQCNRCGATRDFGESGQAQGWSQLHRTVVVVDEAKQIGSFQVADRGYIDLCAGCDEALARWLGTQITGKPK